MPQSEHMEILTQLTLEHFKQMEKLESKYYGEDCITPALQAYEWYVRFPYTTHAAAEEGSIVGFINLFPVTGTTFEGIMAGRFNDKFLTIENIVDITASKTEPLHMFLSCILTEPQYRGKKLTLQLLKKAAETYAPVAHRCDVILTDNVTAEGERFSRKYGFTPVCESDHGSWVYSQSYERFYKRLFAQNRFV